MKIIEYQRIEPISDPFGALIEPVQATESYVTAAEFEIQTTFEQNENDSRCLNPFGILGPAIINRIDDKKRLPNATLTVMHAPVNSDKKSSLFQFDFKSTLKNSGFSLQLKGGNNTGLKLKSYNPSQQHVGFMQLVWEEPAQSSPQQSLLTTRIYALPINNSDVLKYSMCLERHKRLLIP